MVFKPQTFHETPPQAEMDHPTDAILEANVAGALGRASLVDATRVAVTARGAVVTLDGFVGSRSEAEAAVDVAQRVPGVQKVDNQLEIQAAAV